MPSLTISWVAATRGCCRQYTSPPTTGARPHDGLEYGGLPRAIRAQSRRRLRPCSRPVRYGRARRRRHSGLICRRGRGVFLLSVYPPFPCTVLRDFCLTQDAAVLGFPLSREYLCSKSSFSYMAGVYCPHPGCSSMRNSVEQQQQLAHHRYQCNLARLASFTQSLVEAPQVVIAAYRRQCR